MITPTAPPLDENIPVAVAVEVPISAVPVADRSAAVPSVTTTTTTTRIVHLQTGLPTTPVRMTCPFCNQSMITRTREEITGCTIMGVVCLICWFCPLFWLPLCSGCVSNISLFFRCMHKSLTSTMNPLVSLFLPLFY